MAISTAENLSLGKILQIVFSEGVRSQLSKDFKDFELINSFKADISPSRELRFMFQNSLNPASIQYRNPGVTGGRPFPKGFQPSIQENTAHMKTLEATISIDYDMWDRARKTPEKYIEPLSMIVDSTMVSTKRRIAADLHLDGTGVLGQCAAVAPVVSGGLVTFSLNSSDSARGGANLFEYGDIVRLVLQTATDLDGAANAVVFTGGSTKYLKVVDKDRKNNKVTFQPLDANFANNNSVTAVATPLATDVFYRFGQQVIVDLSAIGSSDYGQLTDVMAGLESLAANDGRKIHGITMSGVTAGSKLDAGGNPLDVSHIHEALSSGKVKVGSGYQYKQMLMSFENHYKFIESRETARQFQSVQDNKRGINYFAYIHGNDTVECVESEFCHQKRIWMVPEGKASGAKVLSYGGSDFEPIKANANGDEFRFKVGSSGYENVMESNMKGYGVLIANHPAAIVCVHGFV